MHGGVSPAKPGIQQPRGQLVGAHSGVGARQRIDVLEGGTPLNARDRARLDWPHSNGQQQNQASRGDLQENTTWRSAEQTTSCRPYQVSVCAKTMMVFVEPDCAGFSVQPFEEAHRLHRGSALAYGRVAHEVVVCVRDHTTAAK
jgi:hypothetical protein